MEIPSISLSVASQMPVSQRNLHLQKQTRDKMHVALRGTETDSPLPSGCPDLSAPEGWGSAKYVSAAFTPIAASLASSSQGLMRETRLGGVARDRGADARCRAVGSQGTE